MARIVQLGGSRESYRRMVVGRWRRSGLSVRLEKGAFRFPVAADGSAHVDQTRPGPLVNPSTPGSSCWMLVVWKHPASGPGGVTCVSA